MKPIKDWENVVASGNRESLPPGGYVIKITKVTDNPMKEYLKIIYDIAEGDQAGRYDDDWGRNPDNEFAHGFYRSYKDSAAGMFKAFTNAVEASNAQYIWDWKEEKLVGKRLGIVLAEEEYENNRGEVKVRLYVYSVHPADEIRQGKFKVPELKKLKSQSDFSKAVSQAPDEDLDVFKRINLDDVPF